MGLKFTVGKLKTPEFPFIGLICFLFASHAFSAKVTNSCEGPGSMLNIINRPNNADSPCVIPFKKFEFESGYEYLRLPFGAIQHNLPETELRLGLPAQSEFFIFLPDYIHQSFTPSSGFTQTIVGAKKMMGYNEKWIISVEGSLYGSDGSRAFGNKDTGVSIDTIISYGMSPKMGLTVMIGGSSTTDPAAMGGQRFNSFNPNVVFSYTPQKKISLYAEWYGQTKVSATEKSGFNMDAGILYLVTENIVVDFSGGQQLYGNLDGFKNYLSIGLSWMM